MRNLTRKGLSIALCLLLLLSTMPIAAISAADYTIASEAELITYLTDGQANSLALSADITLSEPITTSAGVANVIDLAGHTITYNQPAGSAFNVNSATGSELTFVNTGISGEGGFVNQSADSLIVNNKTLKFGSGTFNGDITVGGTVNSISGSPIFKGRIEATGDITIAGGVNNPVFENDVTANKISFVKSTTQVSTFNGVVTITGEIYINMSCEVIFNSDVNVGTRVYCNTGWIGNTADYIVVNFNGNLSLGTTLQFNEANYATITFGGSIVSQDVLNLQFAWAIPGVVQAKSLNVSKACTFNDTVTVDENISVTANSTFRRQVSAGKSITITATGSTFEEGITAGETLTISGGSVMGAVSAADLVSQNSNCNFASTVSVSNSLTATNGTFTQPLTFPIAVSIKGGVFNDVIIPAGANVVITGGTFNSEFVIGENATITITGGTFAFDVNSLNVTIPGVEKEGIYVDNGNGSYTVYEFLVTIGSKNYSSLHQAYDAAVDGDTITLIKDVIYYPTDGATYITVSKNITIDLAGFDLTDPNCGGVGGIIAHSLFEIETGYELNIISTGEEGYIATNGYQNRFRVKGTLNITNCKLYTPANSNASGGALISLMASNSKIHLTNVIAESTGAHLIYLNSKTLTGCEVLLESVKLDSGGGNGLSMNLTSDSLDYGNKLVVRNAPGDTSEYGSYFKARTGSISLTKINIDIKNAEFKPNNNDQGNLTTNSCVGKLEHCTLNNLYATTGFNVTGDSDLTIYDVEVLGKNPLVISNTSSVTLIKSRVFSNVDKNKSINVKHNTVQLTLIDTLLETANEASPPISIVAGCDVNGYIPVGFAAYSSPEPSLDTINTPDFLLTTHKLTYINKCINDTFLDGKCTLCGACENHIHNNTGEWIVYKEATCSIPGYKLRTCEDCGAIEANTYTAPHDYVVDVVVAPTCTEDGYTSYVCSVCGDIKANNFVPATGHTFDNDGVCIICGYNKADTEFTLNLETVNSGISAKINGVDQGNITDTGSFTVTNGDTVELTALTSPEKPFMFWTDENGKVRSESATFTFTMNSSRSIKALFEDTENGTVVIYQNTNDSKEIIASGLFNSPDQITDHLATSANRYGFIFDGWDLTVEDIKASIGTEAKIVVTPIYTASIYQVTVVNGEITSSESDMFEPGEKVTIDANIPPEGEVFLYWQDDYGNIISLSQTIYYTVGNKNVTLTAVFGDDKIPVTSYVKVIAEIDGNKILIYNTRYIDNAYSVVDFGLIYAITNDDVSAVMSLENVDGVQVKATSLGATDKNSGVLFNTITNSVADVNLRGYVICEDEAGNRFTIYSSLVIVNK